MDIIVTTPKSQMANAAQEAADCVADGGGDDMRFETHDGSRERPDCSRVAGTDGHATRVAGSAPTRPAWVLWTHTDQNLDYAGSGTAGRLAMARDTPAHQRQRLRLVRRPRVL
ncbi:MAG: hypothetical protein QM234_08340 [Acidobacteriota bacterium]|nr:hypothetical protein [Acidobacteriota bacterium]